ncbi:MAG: hypothetical protein DMF69_11355, partial [Acidobacteria bacterium]
MATAPNKQPDVVYRRIPGENQTSRTNDPEAPQAHRIAPTVTPIIIGFLLLLALISGLGLLSVNQMDRVSITARDLGLQYSARQNLLQNLKLAVTKLNNEARTRAQAESRRDILPPFDFRVDTARDDVNVLVGRLNRPPLSDYPDWNQLRTDTEKFIE